MLLSRMATAAVLIFPKDAAVREFHTVAADVQTFRRAAAAVSVAAVQIFRKAAAAPVADV